MSRKRIVVSGLLCAAFGLSGLAQERVEPVKYGNMDSWVTRKIHESGIIGGATKEVFAIGPTKTIEENAPYCNEDGSPWGVSNVYAKVMGIHKTNVSVFPEKRGDGYCARLETRYESVKVFGIVDIEVIAAGSVFMGYVHEPISGTKNPMRMLEMGHPFTQKPKAIRFDYKVKMSGEPDRVMSTGFSRKRTIKGKDYPAVICLLQKRWEDEKGNIYAVRVGTFVLRYDKDTGWVNGATYPIRYGNITGEPGYVEEWMKLQDQDRYATNHKGKSVVVKEMGWGTADDVPTHLVLQFTSSHGGAYIGSPGNTLWIDNVSFVY